MTLVKKFVGIADNIGGEELCNIEKGQSCDWPYV